MRAIRRVVVHHSLTRDSGKVSWDNIWYHHTVVRGWRSIGYHFGVELVDGRYIAMWGRDLNQQGSHAKGANVGSVGVCFVGDFTSVAPPLEQMLCGARMLRTLTDLLQLPPSAVVGHGEVSDGYECPGAAFPLGGLRDMMMQPSCEGTVTP